MKKIILLAVVSLSFAMNTVAQENSKKAATREVAVNAEETFKMSAVNTVSELDQIVGLNDNQKNDFVQLIYMRKDAMNTVTSMEDKKAVYAKYSAKMLSGLSEEQRKTLELKYPEVYKKFTEYNESK